MVLGNKLPLEDSTKSNVSLIFSFIISSGSRTEYVAIVYTRRRENSFSETLASFAAVDQIRHIVYQKGNEFFLVGDPRVVVFGNAVEIAYIQGKLVNVIVQVRDVGLIHGFQIIIKCRFYMKQGVGKQTTIMGVHSVNRLSDLFLGQDIRMFQCKRRRRCPHLAQTPAPAPAPTPAQTPAPAPTPAQTPAPAFDTIAVGLAGTAFLAGGSALAAGGSAIAAGRRRFLASSSNQVILVVYHIFDEFRLGVDLFGIQMISHMVRNPTDVDVGSRRPREIHRKQILTQPFFNVF